MYTIDQEKNRKVPFAAFNKHGGKFEIDEWLEICNTELAAAVLYYL